MSQPEPDIREKLHVLLLEDDEAEALLVQKMLSRAGWWDFSICHVQTMKDAMEALRVSSFDVSLVDLGLPDAARLEVLAKFQQLAPDLPIVVLTGTDDLGLAMDAVRNGAQDFLLKRESYGDLLARALHYAIERKRTDQDLRQARKMQAVGQLTGGIAHDFNNLLQIVLGSLEFLGEILVDDARSKPLLDTAVDAGKRAAAVTDRLLAFARKQRLNPEVVELSELVTGMIGLMRRALGKTVQIETTLSQDAWRALIDPHQLETALLNLVINGRDSMPKGGILTIDVRNVVVEASIMQFDDGLEAGDYVLLSVTDSGMGMTPEVREQAFEPYFTTRDVGKGNGLGLSMVYGFARQSGGDATLYSEAGKGTTVKIYLPRAHHGQPKLAAVETAEVSGAGRSVLVVEDDEDVLQVIALYLESLGFKTSTAEGFDQAMEILQRGSEFGLLISDLVLPGLRNGLALHSEAKKLDQNMKFILMSGYAEPRSFGGEDVPETVAVLSKPFNRHQLSEAIQHAYGAGSLPT